MRYVKRLTLLVLVALYSLVLLAQSRYSPIDVATFRDISFHNELVFLATEVEHFRQVLAAICSVKVASEGLV